MYTIEKEFAFSASHQLMGLPVNHPCSRVHGHNYVVIVSLQDTKLNKVGFVEDYRALDDIKKFIDTVLDHNHLNDVVQFNPTAENLAKYLFKVFIGTHPSLCSVSVMETPKTKATYTPMFDADETEVIYP